MRIKEGVPRISRFAIVTSYGYLDTIPVLCDLAEMLAQRGHGVDVYTDEWPGFETPVFSSPAVRVVVVRRSWGRRAAGRGAISGRSDRGTKSMTRQRLYALRRILGNVAGIVARSSPWRAARRAGADLRLLLEGLALRSRLGRDAYVGVIGVDPEGLRRAAVLTRFISSPLIYHSLELLLTKELTSRDEQALKAQERVLSRRSSCVIIQDEQRARLLATDNKIPIDRFVFAPNAPLGPARRAPQKYWHEQFELTPDTRVLLHSGSMGPWTGIDDIVRYAADLPAGWVLVVHTRFDPAATLDSEQARRLAELRQLVSPDRVRFSLRPVPRAEVARLVDAADIGIAFYVPQEDGDSYTRENVRTIGLSSGKVAAYLFAGLPIIVNSASTLGDLTTSEGVGVTIDTGVDLPRAVSQISDDYDAYSRRAQVFFDEVLDFRRGFERIYDRISAR